jgi:hypothetical protein
MYAKCNQCGATAFVCNCSILTSNPISVADFESQLTTLKAQLAERDTELSNYRNLKWECVGCENRDGQIETLERTVECLEGEGDTLSLEVGKLNDIIAALTKRVEELVEGFRRIQWTDYHKGDYGEYCIVCGNGKQRDSNSHKPDCWLNRLIQGREGK